MKRLTLAVSFAFFMLMGLTPAPQAQAAGEKKAAAA